MGKLRHIAMQVPDLEKAAQFYEGVFEMERVGEAESPIGNAISLSDGVMNLTLLNFPDGKGGMINDKKWLPSGKKVDLTIYEIENWDTQTGYFSVPPSPNIPDFETALIYNGMCLLEGTNLSEGRGTENPFLLFGAPWMNSKVIIEMVGATNKEFYEIMSEAPADVIEPLWRRRRLS